MREVAVVDRLVEGARAVLLIGDPPKREITIPLESLPAGTREGHWLEVELDADRVVNAAIDEAATERAKASVRDKLEALRKRGRRLS